jgi:uncharacterized protein YbjQ (UPF0145 family)
MIVTTTGSIRGKRIVRTLGLVRGNTIRARHIGKDIMAGLRNVVGGEIAEYTKLFAQAREQALDRMVDEARDLGANAILGATPRWQGARPRHSRAYGAGSATPPAWMRRRAIRARIGGQQY